MLAELAPAQAARRPIRVVTSFALAPDGQTLVFAHQGDLWLVSSRGGAARQITQGPAQDGRPSFSPDGKWLAFESDRGGNGMQIWVQALAGGEPQQRTFHSARHYPLEWTSDGSGIVALVPGLSPFRELQASVVTAFGERRHPRRLFETPVRAVWLSPSGKRALVSRTGRPLMRRGYRGSAAAQLWLASLAADPVTFTRLSPDHADAMNDPWTYAAWIGEGEILVVSERNGVRDLYRRQLATGKETRITDFGVRAAQGSGSDAAIGRVVVARNGSRAVFYRGFDLWTIDLEQATDDQHPAACKKLEIFCNDDVSAFRFERRLEKRATAVAFTRDGKELAFLASGDLWVMDRVLREPVRVTKSADAEREPVFSHDGTRLYFCSDRDGHQPDIWVATKQDAKQPWFLQKGFRLARITNDAAEEDELDLSPDGKRLTFVREGTLQHTDLDGKNPVVVDRGWDRVDYDWSPDGRYLVIARNDPSFNLDVWIVRADGSGRVVNLSRHPDNDRSPTWSPEGGRVAWLGRREGNEWDIYYANLDPKLEEETAHDRKLEKARKALAPKKKPAKKKDAPKKDAPKKDAPKKHDRLVVEDVHDRVHRVRSSGDESRLFWSKDGKKLFFHAVVQGKSGTYAIEFPDKLRPKFQFEAVPSSPQWTSDKELVGMLSGVPAAMSIKGKIERFAFEARTTWDWRARRVAVFREAWRTIGAAFYDPALNGRDWNAVGDRYAKVAADCLWPDQMEWLVNEMLGELNGSHLGYRRAPRPGSAALAPTPAWRVQTYDLGLVFDRKTAGDGLLVAHALYGGPARRLRSRVKRGERVLSIDATPVEATTDLTTVLNLETARTLTLVVRAKDGSERDVRIDPIPFAARRALLYEDWVHTTRKEVERASKGKLGWLHIRGMNMPSFARLEADLYAAGAGKDGLLIDVRWNGGGSTADHVLTVLCQPSHATTLPRNATTPGYPQGRRVYATWEKPIVILCNQRSFSNAEILSHAIQTLGRGKIVGERTAGGVISTGGTRLQDGSFLRLPFRGWFLKNGQDMELNGCLPDVRVLLGPNEQERHTDPQLAAAIEVCLADVAKRAAAPKVKLIRRSERGKRR